MDTQDQKLPCDACGGTFAFSTSEREFYQEKGFNPPKRCAGARNARKTSGQQERYPNGCPFNGGTAGQAGGRPGGARPRPGSQPRPTLTGTGEYRNGEIVKYMQERGFGFLRGDDQQDYFFDATAADGLGSVRPGVRVTFEVVDSPRGPRAQNVTAE
ncbi:MAG: Cold-shock protein [Cyanobacteria bacterium RYN_339]|nr:Cold-shock protein [Cyanobacteria bacterium RYN_339]